MTESLGDKLIRCGWVTQFNVKTLVNLIEKHYNELNSSSVESEDDYLILEWLDCNEFKEYYMIVDAKTKTSIKNIDTKIKSLDEAKNIVKLLRKHKTAIYYKVD